MAIEDRILLVDDDTAILTILETMLTKRYKYKVDTAKDSDAALQLIRENAFDLVISDINMPGMDGLELMEHILRRDPHMPVILITGYADVKTMQTAIRLGVYDFLRKPFNMEELHVSVKQAIHKRKLSQENEKYTSNLEILLQEKATELFEVNRQLERNFVQTVLAMINALEASDVYTKGHSERVTSYSVMIGQEMNLPRDQIKLLRIGAVLHDLGKIGIYQTLLNKPSRLSDDELDIIRQHPVIGEKILRPIELPDVIRHIVLQHHERIDGSGYPHQLKKHEISPLAKIVAVADAFDAMTSGRPYRQSISKDKALQEIHTCAGTQFEYVCVNAFLAFANAQDICMDNNLNLDNLLHWDL